LEHIETMHLEYFGLAKPPFAGEPDTDIFFPEAGRTPLLRRIYADLQSGSPVVRLIGAEGTGKTLLCQLLARLLPAEFQAVYLASPAGSFDELLRAVCQELGQKPQADMPAWLHNHVEQCRSQGKRFLLIIDQAEAMFPAALERLLRLLFTATEPPQPLQVILAGRSTLNDRIEQLQAYCADMDIRPAHLLEPLTEAELTTYLSFRLKAAGLPAADSNRALSSEAVRRIFEHAQGSLRTVHLLADQALQRACAADRYFPVQAADVPPPEGALARKQRPAASSNHRLKLLTIAILLLLAGLLFNYRDLLRRSGQKTASEIVPSVPVKPEELLPVPDQLKLNSEAELPLETEPEIAAEPETQEPDTTAFVAQEQPPAAEVSAVSAAEQEVPPPAENNAVATLPEESLDTPATVSPERTVEQEQSAASPQKKIIELVPGMRKTKPKLKETQVPMPVVEHEVAPATVERTVAPDADQLYQELLAAGNLLKNSRNVGRYTIQLLTLSSPDSATKIKEMIVRDEYLEHRSQLKLLRRQNSSLFVFYGNYGSLEEAQAAVDEMPLFLRKQHHPAAVSVADALSRTGS
jgi:type II secretory pathway predicted ATPase ExeA